jgi:hypothetical protein
MKMNSRFAKIISIAVLSAFLTGCIGDSSQDNSAEDYEEKHIEDYSKAKADLDYAKEEFNQGNYLNATKGAMNAIGNYVAAGVDKILEYMAQSKGSYRIDPHRLVGHKGDLKSVALTFASKSKTIVTDYYDGGQKIPLGQMVLKYSFAVGSSRGEKPLRQRLVATIQFHEANNSKNAQLSILCNDDRRHSVDFGIGQVNTVSWSDTGPCKGMVDENIVNDATRECQRYHSNPQQYIDPVTGKPVSINVYILRMLENKYGGIENLVKNPKSPFNPITNTMCSYRHLDADYATARNLFRSCSSLESISGGKFRCSGSSNLDSDYAAVALIAYGGITKEMVALGIRLRNKKTGEIKQTIDDYLAEFRASYSALFKEPPPF